MDDPDQVAWARNAWIEDGFVWQWAGYARGVLCAMMTLRDVVGGGMAWRIRIFGMDVATFDAEDEARAKERVARALRDAGSVTEFVLWLGAMLRSSPSSKEASPPARRAVQQVG